MTYEEKFAFLESKGIDKLTIYHILGFTEKALDDEDYVIRLEAYRKLGFTKKALDDEDCDVRSEAQEYFKAKEPLESEEKKS